MALDYLEPWLAFLDQYWKKYTVCSTIYAISEFGFSSIIVINHCCYTFIYLVTDLELLSSLYRTKRKAIGLKI